MQYNWQQKDWPNFKYNLGGLEASLQLYGEKTGHIKGILSALPADTQLQAIINRMVSEAIKTSEIEGEYISRQDVVSSIKNNLGLNAIIEPIRDKRAKGIARLMLDIRATYQDDLTEATLHRWHKMLMEGNTKINAGTWRVHESPMQVVSGSIGKEKIHFEAPPSQQVPAEMERFLKWFKETKKGGIKEIKIAAIRSAIAHVYFETIHPYEDGNGRIGRAISEKALCQGANMPILISLSEAIEAKKQAYYQALMAAQRTNELSSWIRYFMNIVLTAQHNTELVINFTLKKAKFFDYFSNQFNPRQIKVIRRMLRDGETDFKDGMSAKKYMSIAKTSKATATRDLQELVKLGAFRPFGAGRSSRYHINLDLPTLTNL